MEAPVLPWKHKQVVGSLSIMNNRFYTNKQYELYKRKCYLSSPFIYTFSFLEFTGDAIAEPVNGYL